MASIALLICPANILLFTAVAVLGVWGTNQIQNAGPHGLSEILYLYESSNANNGSAFGGLTSNSDWFNWSGGFAMLIGPLPVRDPAYRHRRLDGPQAHRGTPRWAPSPPTAPPSRCCWSS